MKKLRIVRRFVEVDALPPKPRVPYVARRTLFDQTRSEGLSDAGRKKIVREFELDAGQSVDSAVLFATVDASLKELADKLEAAAKFRQPSDRARQLRSITERLEALQKDLSSLDGESAGLLSMFGGKERTYAHWLEKLGDLSAQLKLTIDRTTTTNSRNPIVSLRDGFLSELATIWHVHGPSDKQSRASIVTFITAVCDDAKLLRPLRVTDSSIVRMIKKSRGSTP